MKKEKLKIRLICSLLISICIIDLSPSFETQIKVGTLNLDYRGNRFISDTYSELGLNFYWWNWKRVVAGYSIDIFYGDFQTFSSTGLDINFEINYILKSGFEMPVIFLYSGYIPLRYRLSNRLLVCTGGGISYIDSFFQKEYGYNLYLCFKWYYLPQLGIGTGIKSRMFPQQNLMDYTFNVLILF